MPGLSGRSSEARGQGGGVLDKQGSIGGVHRERPLRVLHATESTVAGVETHILQIFERIDRDRFDCTLLCRANSSLAENARDLGIPVIPFDLRRSISATRDLSALFRLVRIVRRNTFDIVHCHSSKAGFIGRLAARLAGNTCTVYTPNAFYYIGLTGWRKRAFLGLERLARPWTDQLIATSASEAERAMREVGFDQGDVMTIYNSIAVTPRNSADDMTRSTEAVVLFAGRLSFQKNPEMFVRMSVLVRRKIPDAKFLMIGFEDEEPYSERIRAMIKDLDMEDRYELVGWIERHQMLERVRRATLMVVPSRYESFGYVAAEAMIHEKPVVATNVDGLRDVVEDRVTGYLVPLDEDEEMAERVVEILRNPVLQGRMGECGRRRVSENFNIEINIKLLEDTYRNALQRS
jgi:glycosyltransferase involved in cell wall biosynthesis